MPNAMGKQLLSLLLIAVTIIGCGTDSTRNAESNASSKFGTGKEVQDKSELSQDLLQLASESDGKQTLNIVTLGHTDHGMETVTAAIVKRQADKGLAEPVHLADILAGHAVADFSNSFQIMHTEVSYMSSGRTYSHIQCRTYLDYVKELIAGPKRFDGAVLVVSAADGPMPQTKGHISLAQKVAIPSIVVFLDKCDLVDDKELLELVELEIRELLSKYGFPGDNIPIIRGNSLPAYQNPSDPAAVKCIDDLLDAIDSSIPDPVLAKPGSITLHKKIEAEVYCFSKDEGGRDRPFLSGYRPQFCFVTTNETAMGTLVLLGNVEMCMPGENVHVSVNLDNPAILEKGFRFSIRDGNQTVGVGIITDLR